MVNQERLDDGLKASLQNQGLVPRAIERHRELLVKAIRGGSKPTFKILDTCRRDNGAVLPPAEQSARKLSNGHAAEVKANPGKGYVAFIPAAGAASRYSLPLANVIDALEASGKESLSQALKELDAAGASAWPLPDDVKALLKSPERQATLTQEQRMQLLRDLQLPKALMPCVAEGTSFMEMKHLEHRHLRGLDGEVYVTPAGMQAAFKERFNTIISSHAQEKQPTFGTRFLEQGPALSTIRFQKDGQPYREDDGALSLVPAGHGALASLFPEVKAMFPAAHSIFIRNIDNVMGTAAPAIIASETFLTLHSLIVERVRKAREALAAGNVQAAAEAVQPLLVLQEGQPSSSIVADVEERLAAIANEHERVLWEVQMRIFHSRPSGKPTRALLTALYARPVNTLGQVPNTSNDVGGTPCFVEDPESEDLIKVCIEVPHVSDEDKRDYLANPVKATHFNPVFAAAELTTDPEYYAASNKQFWLLADKTFRGKPVIYFETVLYELLGNSALANTIFVEVPRLVFNPHKTLKDAVNRSVRDWLPA